MTMSFSACSMTSVVLDDADSGNQTISDAAASNDAIIEIPETSSDHAIDVEDSKDLDEKSVDPAESEQQDNADTSYDSETFICHRLTEVAFHSDSGDIRYTYEYDDDSPYPAVMTHYGENNMPYEYIFCNTYDDEYRLEKQSMTVDGQTFDVRVNDYDENGHIVSGSYTFSTLEPLQTWFTNTLDDEGRVISCLYEQETFDGIMAYTEYNEYRDDGSIHVTSDIPQLDQTESYTYDKQGRVRFIEIQTADETIYMDNEYCGPNYVITNNGFRITDSDYNALEEIFLDISMKHVTYDDYFCPTHIETMLGTSLDLYYEDVESTVEYEYYDYIAANREDLVEPEENEILPGKYYLEDAKPPYYDYFEIKDISDTEIVFDVEWYRIAGMEDVAAYFDDDEIASFEYSNDDYYATGYIEFYDHAVSLTLTESNLPYTEEGTYNFYLIE